MSAKKQNARRAEQAYRAVLQYTDYGDDQKADIEIYISDMLTNLMHLCDEYSESFYECLARSRRHYDAEIAEAIEEVE